MKKITSIKFVNYKAFWGDNQQNTITIADGKNLLIYGENGSGKSSIYEGLKQFFNSSDATSDVSPARHIAVPKTTIVNPATDSEKEEITPVSVIISFLNDNDQIEIKEFGVPNETVRGTAYISKANLLNSFLSYRELLKTYLMDNVKDKKEFRTKFANLIIETILAKNINSGTQNTYAKSWNNLFVPRVWYKEENLEKFASGLTYDINSINLTLNEILKYFEPDLEVKLSLENAAIDYIYSPKMDRWGKYPTCEIDLEVKLFGLEVENDEENHLTVLNEARLSALAISIYLSSLINTPQDNFEFKILFLDDIFIGLDTGNRLPLLNILSKFKKPIINQFVDPVSKKIVNEILKIGGESQYEAEPFFNSFQIFITTYDKHWFEISKHNLKEKKWQGIEIYSHRPDGFPFDLPLVISPVLNYYQKAEAYYKKSSDYKDFPASANYLRKEYEQQFKRILYGNYLLKSGEKGSTSLREELDDLRQSFEKLISDLNLNYLPFTDFPTIVKTTLNPLSHDNLQKPIYARELQEAFILVEKLREIEKEIFLSKGDLISLTTINNGIERITYLSVSNDVFKYNQSGIRRITPISTKPIRYEENGTSTNLSQLKVCEIEKAYDMIFHSVFAINNASNGKNILVEFVTENNESLNDLLNI